MSARLLYGALLTGSLAMLLYFGGFVCLQIGLVLLATLLFAMAGKVLLLAFGLLVLLAAGASLIAVWRELRRYFSREMAALRRLLALQSSSAEAAQLSLLERRQLQYFGRLKRERLLVANNRKHLKSLFDATYQELQAAKSRLPVATYQSLRKALRHYHKQADAQAMLALRKQLP